MLSKSHTKYIQSLQHKKQRDAEGLFVAEGPKLVPELLRSRAFACRELLALESWTRENETLIAGFAPQPQLLEEYELEKISGLSVANNVLAVFEQRVVQADFDPAAKIILALDTIQDPGNLGTIIRIADWFGVSHIIASYDSADLYNSKVVQSTMGSIARVELLYADLEQWIGHHPAFPVYAAALNGETITAIGKPKEGLLVIGNESKGISAAILELASHKISIPGKGTAESLNAAVATGIILSHLVV